MEQGARSIEVAKIKYNRGANDRTEREENHIKKIAKRIQQKGFKGHIQLRYLHNDPEGFLYEVVWGETRLLAAVSLGHTTIPAEVDEMTDEEAADEMFAENTARADLLPIDLANAFQKRIRKFGYTPEQLAEKYGFTPDLVKGRLNLLRLHPDYQKLVQHGKMQLQYAAELAKLEHPFQHKAFEYFASTDKISIHEFRKVVSQCLTQQNQPTLFDAEAFMLKSMEVIIAELPLSVQAEDPAALKRENDALYQTVFALRREVQDLRAKLLVTQTALQALTQTQDLNARWKK